MAQEAGDNARNIQRYIRLTHLIPELLELVDQKKMSFNPAVELSYLTDAEQRDFLQAILVEEEYSLAEVKELVKQELERVVD